METYVSPVTETLVTVFAVLRISDSRRRVRLWNVVVKCTSLDCRTCKSKYIIYSPRILSVERGYSQTPFIYEQIFLYTYHIYHKTCKPYCCFSCTPYPFA